VKYFKICLNSEGDYNETKSVCITGRASFTKSFD